MIQRDNDLLTTTVADVAGLVIEFRQFIVRVVVIELVIHGDCLSIVLNRLDPTPVSSVTLLAFEPPSYRPHIRHWCNKLLSVDDW